MDHVTGIKLQPRLGEPLYRQLFDAIVERIRSGTFPTGYRLPATRELSRELGTHRNTVVRAYEELVSAGFVLPTVGRGTFVAPLPASHSPLPQTVRGRLPWQLLASRSALAEPLSRSERSPRRLIGKDVIHLNQMQPSADLLPVDLMRRCIEHVLRTQRSRALGYAPREGLPSLRELIVKDLARQGVPARPEDLIVTTGSQQAVDLVARALINPGDTFLTDEATYVGAVGILSLAQPRLVGIPSDAQGPELSALTRHQSPGVKGFYLMPNCRNPTGERVSAERRQQIVDWSHRAGVPIIEDDYASDLQLDDGHALPPMKALDGEVIYIGTYSKKLIPALRIGYLVCPPSLCVHVSRIKGAMDLGTSALWQHALAEFLDRGYLVPHLQRTLAEYRKRRDALETALAKHLPRLRWETPHAGVFLWIPLPHHLDPDALVAECQKLGLLISSGTANAVVPDAGHGVRLTFCAEPVDRMNEAARRLARAYAIVEREGRGPRSRDGSALQAV